MYICLAMESLPRVAITGASGFLGRRVLDLLKSQYKLIAIDLRSQSESGVPKHPNISWHQFDICNENALQVVCNEVKNGDDFHSIIHLAAYSTSAARIIRSTSEPTSTACATSSSSAG